MFASLFFVLSLTTGLAAHPEIPSAYIPIEGSILVQGGWNVARTTAADKVNTLEQEQSGWQRLRSELIQEVGRDHFQRYAAPVVPTTMAYLIEKYADALPDPRAELHIHLIGSTYIFEGMSNWTWLARALPADVQRVQVALIMGTPFQEDGVMVEKNGSVIDFDIEDAGQLDEPILLQTEQAGSGNPLHKEELREQACRAWHYGSKVVDVKCYEHLYQTVADLLPPAHLAVMINPGFPLPWRRSYDGVLKYLLEHNTPSVVSAELVGDKIPQSMMSSPGQTVEPKNTGGNDESFQTLSTLHSYRANILGVTTSPFPYLYEAPEDQNISVLKNAVLQVFKGRAEDAEPLTMAEPLVVSSDPRSIARKHHTPEEETVELFNALRTNVTTAYAAAMTAWASSQGFFGVSSHHAPSSIEGWMQACWRGTSFAC